MTPPLDLDVWGQHRRWFEIDEKAEVICTVLDLQGDARVAVQVDRRPRLNKSILCTKVILPEPR